MNKKFEQVDFELEFGEEAVANSTVDCVSMQEVSEALTRFMGDAISLKQDKPTKFTFKTKDTSLTYEQIGQAIVDVMGISVFVVKIGVVNYGQVSAL